MNVLCSGVVVYALNPSDRELYILLGKERGCKQWPKLKNKWSHFSGVPDKGDVDKFHTAAREFYEETAGVVICPGTTIYLSDEEAITKMADVLRSNSEIEIVNTVYSHKYMQVIGLRSCFPIKIPYDDKIPNYFQDKLMSMELDDKYTEKKELKWIPLKEVVKYLYEKNVKHDVKLRRGFIPTLKYFIKYVDKIKSKNLRI